MKGLNVKRIAALGIGAALVGSALAPAVMAGVFSNVDSLQKTSIVNSTGTPVVDIVVGSMGQAADVVWAGNIAAKVAQLATTDSGSVSRTADIVVGKGTTTLIGEGRESKITFPGSFNMTVDNGKTSSLINNSSWEYKLNGATENTRVVESIFAKVDLNLQDEPDGLYAGQIVGTIEDKEKIGYEVTFDAELPFLTDKNNFDMTIPLFGKTWEVRSISNKEVVLGSDQLPTKVYVGESIKVQGKGQYAGKELDLTLIEVARSNTGLEYAADFALYDGSNVIAYERGVVDNKELHKLSKFEDHFSTPVTIDVVREGEGSKRYTDLQVGEGTRLTLEHNKEFIDDGNDKAEKWIVVLDTTATGLKGIKITNSNKYTYSLGDADYSKLQGSGADAYRMGPMTAGTEIDIADQGMYVYTFNGMTTETMYTSRIADGVLTTIIDSRSRDIPMWFGPFSEGRENVVEIADRTFTVYAVNNANQIRIFNKDNVDDPEVDTADFSVDIVAGFTDSNVVSFNIDYDSIPDVNYQVIAYQSGNDIDYFLALDANQTLGVDVDGTKADIKLNGSYIDTNEDVKYVSYYAIPTSKIPNVIANNYIVDGNALVLLDKSSSADLSVAQFTVADRPGAGALPITAYIDVRPGNLKDSDKDYVQFSSSDPQVLINEIVELDSTDKDKLVASGTDYGTEVSAADSEFVWSIPDAQRKFVSYLGSSDRQEVPEDGVSYTDLSVGEGGGGCTITKISGSSTGKTIVPVKKDLVKLDTDASSGKAIIVGGHMVNRVAATISVEGQTLKDRLVSDGDWVAAVLDNGSIVVAGWTANDTATAARELINKLESFL